MPKDPTQTLPEIPENGDRVEYVVCPERKGVVVGLVQSLNGCTRCQVRAEKLDENTRLSSHEIDYHALKIIKKNVKPANPPTYGVAQLGDLVESTIDKFVGVVTARVIYIEGNVELIIESRTLNKEGKLPVVVEDSRNVKVLEKGVVPSYTKDLAKPPGPPSTEVDDGARLV